MKWNDFHSNVSKSFGVFRNEEYLHDVTLVSDDQLQVSAHKLVLSASSQYFKNIFKSSKLTNPFICLDISSNDLNNILDYIYNGEIQIYEEHLDRFLAIAQRFKLEGLLGDAKVEEEEKTIPDFEPPPSFGPSPLIQRPEKVNPKQIKSDVDNTVIQLNNENQPLDTSNLADIDNKLYENMLKNSDRTYSCKLCNKTLPYKTHMKFHVETHMEGLTFPCNTCGKEFRSRNTFRAHFSKNRCK